MPSPLGPYIAGVTNPETTAAADPETTDPETTLVGDSGTTPAAIPGAVTVPAPVTDPEISIEQKIIDKVRCYMQEAGWAGSSMNTVQPELITLNQQLARLGYDLSLYTVQVVTPACTPSGLQTLGFGYTIMV